MNAASGRDLRSGRVDTPALVEAVAALDADAVAVQEVDHLLPRSAGVDQTALLAAGLGGRGRFVATVHGTPGAPQGVREAHRTVADEPSYGIALLLRGPHDEALGFRELRMPAGRGRLPVLDPAAGLRLIPDEPRAVVAAVLRTPAGPVSVLATHLSFTPWQAGVQLRRIREFARTLPRPLVLLGDLNLPPGVVRRVLPWTPLVTGPTFPSPAPKVQLDHALADGLPAAVRVSGRVERVGGSDHRAVVVDLEL
ncbi:endonuclease/exonuclease/phosphatase family protein [Kineococcus rhizosphaerae]|uniref:endonuclease/exonuclease/phosphatase family protein n=1 Tax=Kineococcus rhizosphaerae TaxID=559628 RepID=UPI001473971D|nr:endonuclease/exonuclease/phosphatase family protein [Kineococcus rhizosphaerae]